MERNEIYKENVKTVQPPPTQIIFLASPFCSHEPPAENIETVKKIEKREGLIFHYGGKKRYLSLARCRGIINRRKETAIWRIKGVNSSGKSTSGPHRHHCRLRVDCPRDPHT
jgi:hypothetical protein